MCISAASALLAAAALGSGSKLATGLIGGSILGGGGSKPVDQQAVSDARAAQSANGRLARRRRALKDQSLLTGADVMSTGILNGGKPTLGGG